MTTFYELGLSNELMKAIRRMGFEETTPIQAETIPLSLQNKDVIGQAQTGTGKTAAFGIPLIEKVDVTNEAIQGLVVAPTRELAIQVSEELYKIGAVKRVRVLPIYGGQDIGRQIRALKKRPHIIVGTPGRIIDHINRKTLHLENVHTVVLDEADEMLNMGFIDDIEAILSNVPEKRQTLLFSATMPEPIRRIAERFMNEPQIVKVKAKEMTVPNIQQYYLEVQEKKKFDILTRLLDIQAPELAIVFGRTKRRVDELAEALNLRGYAAEGIHGDLSQAKRLSVLRKFKEGSIEILVATDVAARGLDISGVTHVYNFDIPQDPESYVHRIGRTGRAGKTGVAMTFVTPREIGQLHNIERTTKRKMERMKPPTLDEALEGQQRIAVEKLIATVETENLSFYKRAAEELLEEHDSVSLVAACIKMLTKEPDTTPVQLTEEPPLPVKREKKRANRSGSQRERSKKRRVAR
ncbi:DEAD/DEAH box helicase [Parageobacillus thermoglucosidasius]|uniref:DEAD-box ATP-dependent RNA helicase CshA n=3 Tax=Anoxybacillaceae TaxID=3120669 RepID=A0AB38R1G9_PARTM|nr:DEAD/DEAH box helicase [Parageobacillus thermoglucosidasius]AEH49531.1 DEAD/DEAH box helicase domain protein [Parageobacillus thermoglucosidasius C56-YS93]ALF09325.1 DEAD/DEAH box helicase [Parageobacillus thermoglucosidasius]ANZ29407.1 DEAD/DEAH box helicase [Parageobacillus thermoglucosidasius]APM80145.1 DEAD/DEAH box helicase [Parageobacillus thermoglucosidasius]KJX67735.1 DEAD/DEAH box helicase [Parageobacillus thermoglucosidasius]